MKTLPQANRMICLVLAMLLAAGCLSACAGRPSGGASDPSAEEAQEDERFLTVVDEEPDTVDFQCTTIYYTIAQNVFDRLVETVVGPDGEMSIVPSLAESWVVSDDGLRYTFHLRDGVRFHDGALLTSDDVYYTFFRLLTHPYSCNRDIARNILGADRLEKGETDVLEGFHVLNDRDFSITLEQPFCNRIPQVKVFSGIPREIVDHDRFPGCLGDLLIVGINLLRSKAIVKRRRGRNRVKAQLHGAAGVFLSFFHGNRPYMGDQVRALRKLRSSLKDLHAL